MRVTRFLGRIRSNKKLLGVCLQNLFKIFLRRWTFWLLFLRWESGGGSHKCEIYEVPRGGLCISLNCSETWIILKIASSFYIKIQQWNTDPTEFNQFTTHPSSKFLLQSVWCWLLDLVGTAGGYICFCLTFDRTEKKWVRKSRPMLLPLLFGLGPFPFEQEKRVFTVAITQNSTLLQKYCWWPTAGPANW